MRNYLLAFDIGTTACKAAIYDDRGNLTISSVASYDVRFLQPGWVEQDPGDWWTAVCGSAKELLSHFDMKLGRIAAVSFSAMMNGCVLATADGTVIRPALIHADTRAARQSRRIAGIVEPERVCAITGNRLAPYFTLSKLAWLVENEPDSVKAASWSLQAKDWLVGKLTGVFGITDPSDASLTGMYDMQSLKWSEELALAASVPLGLLPVIMPSSSIVGAVTPEAAKATGLREGTPVVLGGGDGACATAGSGAHFPGDGYHYLGTTSWIGAVTDGYRPDPMARISTLHGLSPGQYVNYGTVQTAAGALEWFIDAVGVNGSPNDRYIELEQLAASSPAGANGLFFLPFLQGERSPIWDSDARGVYFGLSSSHQKADLARAVLEGVAFALNSVLTVFDEQKLIAGPIRALGGGMRNRVWRDIIATIYNRPLLHLENLSEATSAGAAMNAGVGIGLFENMASAGSIFTRTTEETVPDPKCRAKYDQAYGFYKSLYPALKTCFELRAELESSNPDFS